MTDELTPMERLRAFRSIDRLDELRNLAVYIPHDDKSQRAGKLLDELEAWALQIATLLAEPEIKELRFTIQGEAKILSEAVLRSLQLRPGSNTILEVAE